jgi:AraC-like DNA-binding protein
MQKISETRSSDSPFIQSVTRVKYTDDSIDLEPPDGHWAIVVLKHHGKTNILHTGTVTKPVKLRFEKDDEYIGISFKPSAFLTRFPAQQMVNTGMYLPQVDKRKFRLGDSAWEIPTFDNAEALANQLVNQGLLATDDIVETILKDLPKAFSIRSMQRHFMQTTGIALKYFRQIQRAHQASQLLQTGSTPLDAALAAGYYDQAHMTNSLKKLIGKTPTEIIQSSVE